MLTPAEISPKIRRCANERPRRWRRLVRIAYFDEAGVAHESQEPYVVVGGVLIHGDTQWHPIEISANSIITSLVPEEIRSSFYFHAYRLFSDHKSFKGLLSAERRFQILRDLVTIIAYYELPISYGAITRSEITKQISHWKPSERTHMAHQLAFSLCAMGFQGWFYRESSDEVAICVAAKTDEKNRQLHLKQ